MPGPPSPLLFLPPTPLRPPTLLRPLPVLVRSARRFPSACQRDAPRAAQGWHARQSSALNQDTSADRYIDLHTMQVIRAANAHLCDTPHPNTSFGLFDGHAPLSDAAQSEHIRELLFTADTVPLSEPQKDVVQALLSRRSALFVAPTSRDKHPLLVDVVMRSRLWKELIVYCADSPRAAEAAYTLLCAQLPADRRHEVQLHLDSLPQKRNPHTDGFGVIITSPPLVRSALADCDESDWLQNTAIFFVDTLTHSNATQWEEILLALPSRILLCVFTTDLPYADHQLLPLWLETIQNSMISVTPSREASFAHRIENPQHSPLLRTFAYNAATHDSPVQVSLTLLKQMFDNRSQLSFVPKYSECFLHGIKMIPTENPSTLLFRNAEEAKFADIAALVVSDAKTIVRSSRRKRRRPGKGKERTASSRAAAKKRRDAAYGSSLLFPAIAFVTGRGSTENAARAVESAMGDELSLLWDDDSREHVEDIVEAFKTENESGLTDTDVGVLEVLLSGIGIVHAGVSPAVRVVAEELFRAGLVPLLCADSFLGSTEILAMPCAKSILIDASAIGVCDDATKGLVGAATVAALAGRAQKDDVGNLLFLWYDESVDDETAGYEITSTLLHRMFLRDENEFDDYSTSSRMNRTAVGDFGEYPGEKPHCVLSSSYGGVLRSVRRFGTDGYESIFEYTLNSYRGWLERAAIRATLERLGVEKAAISSRLECEDWGTIAEHERREAKVDELKRVLRAMETRYTAVLSRRVLNELGGSSPGRLIGVVVPNDAESNGLAEQRWLLGGEEGVGATAEGESDERNAKADRAEDVAGSSKLVAKEKESWKERMVSAVFVTVLDQDKDGKRISGMESGHLVVCIMADGLWTIVPLSDVVALAGENEKMVANVDLLMMPHPATFDVEPQSQHATCRPIDEVEQEAVCRISDELIALVASEERPELAACTIAEFETQKKRVAVAQGLLEQSMWYGKEEEIVELRKLRRRVAKLGDEMEWLQKRENELEEELFNKHNDHRSNQQAVMAVMEDCHGVTVHGECSMEMTPIGELGSVLPCEFPLFAGACVCLIDELGSLSAAQFAAVVALVVCGEEGWEAKAAARQQQFDEEGRIGGSGERELRAEREEDEEDEEDVRLDLSILQRDGGADSMGGNMHMEMEMDKDGAPWAVKVGGVPERVTATVGEIWQALKQLHERHVHDDESRAWSVRDIAPGALNTAAAEAVRAVAEEDGGGGGWARAVRALRGDAHGAARQLRRVRAALQVVAAHDAADGDVRRVAAAARDALARAPHATALTRATLAVADGVAERLVAGGAYERWWRGARDALTAAAAAATAAAATAAATASAVGDGDDGDDGDGGDGGDEGVGRRGAAMAAAELMEPS